MQKDPKALFKTLGKQIGLDLSAEEEKYVNNAEITAVKVYKDKKLWEFYFLFDQILPFALYKKLELSLKLAFSKIANIAIQIDTRDSSFSQKLIDDYWMAACQDSQINSPICNQELGQPL